MKKSEAKRMLKKLREENKKYTYKYLLAEGILLLYSGEMPKANTSLRKALSLNPIPECHYFLGITYLNLQSFKKAYVHFSKATVKKGWVNPLLGCYVCLMALRKREEAMEFLKRAMSLDPIKSSNLLKDIVGKNNPLGILFKELESTSKISHGK